MMQEEEFVPELFMEPIKRMVEFQVMRTYTEGTLCDIFTMYKNCMMYAIYVLFVLY